MARPTLPDLLRHPVVVAPMVGGPSTAELVIAAAAAEGDTDRMSLWVGQGYRSASEQPAGEIIERLCATC